MAHAINKEMHQGADFDATYTIYNPDQTTAPLGDYSVEATMERYPGSSTNYPFQTTLNIGDSTVEITMSSAVTSTLEPGRYYYNIFLINSNNAVRTKIADGSILVYGSSLI